MRVGIPRALLFHHYGDCWLDFVEASGATAVVSPETTADIITNGAVRADNETCLPVKVFSGHVLSIKDEVDAFLVPRVLSQDRGTCSCPKFLGLPDLARALGTDIPAVIAPRMDLDDWRCAWARDWYQAARAFGAGDLRSVCAAGKLLTSARRIHGEVRDGAGSGAEAGDISIGVAGHLYNVHDDGASLGLLGRMRSMGANPVTVDEVSPADARAQAMTLPREVFWGFERRLAGAVLHWSRSGAVSGILFVTSFACGPGSIVGALLEDQLRSEGSVPIMTITLDEHAAEAGLVTRLEAFIDMLRHTALKPGSGTNASGGAA